MRLTSAPYSRDYEITDAMFGAFRAPGGMPFFWKLFAWGTLLLTVVSVLTVPAAIGGYVDLITSAIDMENDPEAYVGSFLGTLGQVFLIWTLYFIGYVIAMGVIRAAFFRNYFFGDDGRTFPIRFGADEMRQSLVILGYYGLLTVVIILVSILLMLPFIAVGAGSNGNGAIGLLVLSMILLYIAIIAIYIWFGVKFAPAGALTALRGSPHLLAARHVSRNRFWALFGSILVAGLIGYVIVNVVMTAAILIAFSGLSMTDLFTIMAGTDPDATLEAIRQTSEATAFRLASILALALTSAAYAFYILLLGGPQAFFTKQWAEAGGMGGVPIEG